jgi:hypothetical protein
MSPDGGPHDVEVARRSTSLPRGLSWRIRIGRRLIHPSLLAWDPVTRVHGPRATVAPHCTRYDNQSLVARDLPVPHPRNHLQESTCHSWTRTEARSGRAGATPVPGPRRTMARRVTGVPVRRTRRHSGALCCPRETRRFEGHPVIRQAPRQGANPRRPRQNRMMTSQLKENCSLRVPLSNAF